MDAAALEDLLRQAVEAGASDLHLTAGAPPMVRVDGRLQPLGGERWTAAAVAAAFERLSGEVQRRQLAMDGQVAFSHGLPGVARFRVHAFRQRGAVALAVRVIPNRVPSLEELGLPPVLGELALRPAGLVLVAGAPGSGRSTTLAALVRHVNEHRAAHVITLEHPIEYLHSHERSLVHQREVGQDAPDFATAVRAALRQDPDVIVLDQLPDPETVAAALLAAETGRLVLAGVHATSVPQAVERLLEAFPPHHQPHARLQLAATLEGIAVQQLLPRADRPGRVAAVEVLLATPAARSLIREGKVHQLPSVIETGARLGMVSMERALAELRQRGLIAEAEYAARAAGLAPPRR